LTRHHCDLVYIQYVQPVIVCLILLELVSSMILHFIMVLFRMRCQENIASFILMFLIVL